MPNPPLRSRPSAAGPRRRISMSAAARAAAKRSATAEDRRGTSAPTAPGSVTETETETEWEPAPAQAPAPGREREPESQSQSQSESEPGSEPQPEPQSVRDGGPADVPEPDADVPEPDAEAAADEPAAGRTGRRTRVLSAVLALTVVAALVAGAVLAGDYRHGERTRQAGTQALAAARTAAPVVLSYDYRHLDRDFAAALTHLTGSFRDEYRKTTSTVVAPTARQYHAVVTATVAQPAGGEPAASVVSASPGKVVVLLFMNQVTRSTRLDAPRLDLNRVRMTLTRTAAGWKVSAVDAL